MPLPTTALPSIYDKIVHVIPEITYDTLRDEFTDFMSKWSTGVNSKRLFFVKIMTTLNITLITNVMEMMKKNTAAGDKYCVLHFKFFSEV